MIIVIDGYNVLKQVVGREISKSMRNNFISKLVTYARGKKHNIVLVFDGGPHQWPYEERYSGLLVIYSGVRMTADEYIQDYLHAHKKKELLLVSSDHDLNVWASDLDVTSIASSDFYYLLQEAVRSSVIEKTLRRGNMVKLHGEEHAEIDALMEAMGDVPIKGEDLQLRGHEERLQRLSRSDKELFKKLKKL